LGRTNQNFEMVVVWGKLVFPKKNTSFLISTAPPPRGRPRGLPSQALQRLTEAAEKAKMELSTVQQTKVSL